MQLIWTLKPLKMKYISCILHGLQTIRYKIPFISLISETRDRILSDWLSVIFWYPAFEAVMTSSFSFKSLNAKNRMIKITKPTPKNKADLRDVRIFEIIIVFLLSFGFSVVKDEISHGTNTQVMVIKSSQNIRNSQSILTQYRLKVVDKFLCYCLTSD